jgi:hypothetical protein
MMQFSYGLSAFKNFSKAIILSIEVEVKDFSS